MAEVPPKADRWRLVRRAAPWVIATIAVVAILVRYPLSQILEEMQRGNAIGLIPCALGMIFAVWLSATLSDFCVLPPTVDPTLTYGYLLRAKAGVSVLNAFGTAANYGGYAVWIQRRFRCPVSTAVGCVLFITVSDLCAVSVLAGASIWLGGAGVGSELDVIVPIVAAVALVLILLKPRSERPTLAPWHRIPIPTRLLGVVARFGNIGFLILGTWAGARAFGMHVPLAAVASHLPILLVIAALPINVGGFGPVQAAWVAFFSPWAPGPQILAFHFLWQLASFGALMLRGAPWLKMVVADVTGERRGA